MRAGRRHRGLLGALRQQPGDAGFTLVELLVAIMLIGIVMTALTSFFLNTMAITSQQGGKQAAVQLADDAVERVRAMQGSAITAGRDQSSTDSQWTSPVVGVAPHLADTQAAWDATAVFPSGATAPLPTSPQPSLVNGVQYNRHWYIGRCWQPLAGGTCGGIQTAGYVEFFRVVVAVTWTARHCAGNTCSFVTATLVSNAPSEPLFNNGPPPQPLVVTNPGTQTGQVSVAASLQLAATGGTAPLIWSGSGLPTGMSITSGGLISGTPSEAREFTVTVVVTDSVGQEGTASFSWAINGPLVLSDPGDQESALGAPLSLVMPVSGGTAPYTWTVRTPGPWGPTGMPPGLSLNSSTGVISGTPTSTGNSRHLDVTVTDARGATATVRFDWEVNTLRAAQPATQTSPVGTFTGLVVSASGGDTPYTWSATGLPAGLVMHPAGVIFGTPTQASRYVVTIRVDDDRNDAHSVTFVWNITAAAGGVQVTAPTGDRTGDRLGDTVSITATAAGGSGHTWTATGLPPGITMTAAGAITGRITQTGRFTVTLTVRDSANRPATFMFTWTVTC